MSGWDKNVPKIPKSDITVIKRGDSYHGGKASDHSDTVLGAVSQSIS